MVDAPDPAQVMMPMILVLGWLVGILDLLVLVKQTDLCGT